MLNKTEIERNILIPIKSIYEKSTGNMIFNGERMNYFLLSSGIKHGCPMQLSLFDIILEVLASAKRQQKEIKGKNLERKKYNHIYRQRD